MKRKFGIIDILILITIASTTLYFVFRNLPSISGSFAALWAPVILFLMFINRPITFTSKPMRYLLLYGVISVGILQYTLWKYMNDWNQIRILYEFYFLVVFTAIWSYYFGRRDLVRLALISKWSFIFIIITLITTNIALFIDPGIVRDSANNAEFTSFQVKVFNYSGAMGYSYIQAVICLIPILIYHIKNRVEMVFSRKILIAILILLLITEVRSLVFANIIVSVLMVLISFVSSKNIRISLITVSLIGVIFVSIPNSFYANSFYSLSSGFDQNSLMNKKLKSFAVFIENPEFDNSTEIGGRAERYPLLFKSLSGSPFTGDASYESKITVLGGAHLYWMNRLAIWGIPGFLFFLFILFKIYKSISSNFDPGYRFYYLLSVMSLVLLGLLKAVGGREPWLMLVLVIPGLYYLPLLKQKTDNRTLL